MTMAIHHHVLNGAFADTIKILPEYHVYIPNIIVHVLLSNWFFRQFWLQQCKTKKTTGLSHYGQMVICVHTHTHSVLACPWMFLHVWECMSERQRGLSASHWLCAYQFAVISLAWLSSVHCQLSKGLLWACPLMRGCSHALESIQLSNRSRMAAQCLPIALDWRTSRVGNGKERCRGKRDIHRERQDMSGHIFLSSTTSFAGHCWKRKGSNWLTTNLPLLVETSDSAAMMAKFERNQNTLT